MTDSNSDVTLPDYAETDSQTRELGPAYVRALRGLPDDADPTAPIAGSDTAAAD